MTSEESLTWNEFRSLHKGMSAKEMSTLWAQYKDGEYELNEEEAPVENSEAETPVEEAETEVEETRSEDDILAEYKQLSSRLARFRPSLKQEAIDQAEARIAEIAQLTAPAKYTCTPTDGWKYWTGPTQASLLVNESKGVAFTISRTWWDANYRGARYVGHETVAEQDTLESLCSQYARKRRLVRRPPLPGVEIMCPMTNRDLQLRGE